MCFRPDKHEYSIFMSGNLNDEQAFYKEFIIPILIKTFNITPKFRINKEKKSINLVIYSKSLLNYLSKECEIPIGAKSDKVRIPEKFMKNPKFMIAFIKGFVDADFSLCLKKRYKKYPYYPVINGISKSKEIIIQISKFLQSKEITFSLVIDRKQYDNRSRKFTQSSSIHIYGKKNLKKWIDIVGFRNSKYRNIIENIS